MKGFRTEIQKGLKLDVNQTLRADIALKVGDVNERVEVSSTAAGSTDRLVYRRNRSG